MSIKTASRKLLMKKIHRSASRKRHAQSVMFELTYRCNFRCPHCYAKGSSKQKRELTYRQVLYILDELKDMGIYSIAFTGGEPLMRRDIFDILAYSKRLGFQTALLSNGYLIDKTTVAKLRKANVNNVEITLNSLNPKVFDELTGVKGALRRVKSAIKLLIKNGIEVKIKSTATVANRGELVEIGKFARSLNIVYNLDTEVLPCRSQDTSFVERYSLTPDESEEVRRLVYPEMFKGKRSRSRSKRKRDRMFTCGAGKTSFSITPYGKMNFCLEIDYPKLDILSKGAEFCWNGIKKKIDRLNGTKNFICKRCDLINYCGWCPGRSFAETGIFNRCSEYFKERAINAKIRRRMRDGFKKGV